MYDANAFALLQAQYPFLRAEEGRLFSLGSGKPTVLFLNAPKSENTAFCLFHLAERICQSLQRGRTLCGLRLPDVLEQRTLCFLPCAEPSDVFYAKRVCQKQRANLQSAVYLCGGEEGVCRLFCEDEAKDSALPLALHILANSGFGSVIPARFAPFDFPLWFTAHIQRPIYPFSLREETENIALLAQYAKWEEAFLLAALF